MKKIIIILAVLSIVVTGCHKSEEDEKDVPVSFSQPADTLLTIDDVTWVTVDHNGNFGTFVDIDGVKYYGKINYFPGEFEMPSNDDYIKLREILKRYPEYIKVMNFTKGQDKCADVIKEPPSVGESSFLYLTKDGTSSPIKSIDNYLSNPRYMYKLRLIKRN